MTSILHKDTVVQPDGAIALSVSELAPASVCASPSSLPSGHLVSPSATPPSS